MSWGYHISESPDPKELFALCGAELEGEFVPQYVEVETDRICKKCLAQWNARTEPGRTYVCLLFPAAELRKTENEHEHE